MSYLGPFDDLIGTTIIGIYCCQGSESLVINTFQGPKYYAAYGDCCSQSYFQHISGVNVCGGIVSKVEEIDINSPNVDQEEHKAYGWRITTDRGYLEIDMRNDSNGYYGGWVQEGDSRSASVAMSTLPLLMEDM